MLAQFEAMWDGQHWSIKGVQHRIQLEKSEDRPLHSALYRSRPKPREFNKQKTDACPGRYPARADRTGVASCVCSEKGWYSLPLRRLPGIERSDDRGLVLDPVH